MSDRRRHIRLPFPLVAEKASVRASAAQDDDVFAAHQVEFIQHLFGHSTYLRDHARTPPISDAFLIAFVHLFDTLLENALTEACQCVTQLQQILEVIAPDTASSAPPLRGMHIAKRDGGEG